jgi:hypothetical protein
MAALQTTGSFGSLASVVAIPIEQVPPLMEGPFSWLKDIVPARGLMPFRRAPMIPHNAAGELVPR